VKTTLKRSDLIPGFEFNHLGTTYRVVKFPPRTDVVSVMNPASGYKGEIPFKLIQQNGRRK